MSADGQCTKCSRNIVETLNHLSRAHERYRQTTDARAIAYSERECEFTFDSERECEFTFAKFFLHRSSPGNALVGGGVKRKRGSQIQRFWTTYRRLYLGAIYEVA